MRCKVSRFDSGAPADFKLHSALGCARRAQPIKPVRRIIAAVPRLTILLAVLLAVGPSVGARGASLSPEESVSLMAQWWKSHPVCLTKIAADGRFLNVPYTVTYHIFNFLDASGQPQWRVTDEVTRPLNLKCCVYEDPEGHPVVYFPRSKQLIYYDPSQEVLFQIEDWIFRRQIALPALQKVAASVRVIDSEPALRELRLDFDPDKLRALNKEPIDLNLRFSLFFAPDGEVKKALRVLNGETLNITVDHQVMGNEALLGQLPEIAESSQRPIGSNYFAAVRIDQRAEPVTAVTPRGGPINIQRLDAAFTQTGPSCVLSSYAIVANYFTGHPVADYFQAYCHHFGLKFDGPLDAERKYATHFDSEFKRRHCLGSEVILDLHSNATETCFADARRVFEPRLYRKAAPELRDLEQALHTREALMTIAYRVMDDAHSVAVAADGPGFLVRDTTLRGFYPLDHLNEFHDLLDCVLYVRKESTAP